jgi:ubiquinone/menaquinone biosynthesis C-methylase UbiE
MDIDYSLLTEVPGSLASSEQIQRMVTRYRFARDYCRGKDVLEVACGSGQGLGTLAESARKVVGGDYMENLLRRAQSHYGTRMPLLRLDAQTLPFRRETFDVVILYEAIYYLEEPSRFVSECKRILRPGGYVLICQPNKSLPDFHPSPHSFRYFTPPELAEMLTPIGPRTTFFGDAPVDYTSLKSKVLSFVKKTIVRMNLMPRTLKGRERLKRMIYGELLPIPPEIGADRLSYAAPQPIAADQPDGQYRVLFAVSEVEGR